MLAFGTEAGYIIASRALSGFVGGGVLLGTAIYFAEIANDNIRGKLVTTYSFSRSLGFLLAYVLGIYVNYIQASMAYLGIAIFFAISFIFIPATPQHLLRVGEVDVSNKHVVSLKHANFTFIN